MTALRPGRHWLRGFLLTSALLYAIAFAWTGRLIGLAGDAFRKGRHDEAHAMLMKAAAIHVRSGRAQDGLGAVDLARGRTEEASLHLASARSAWFHSPAFGADRVARALLREGSAGAARLYAEHRLALDGEDPQISLTAGLACLGENRLEEAARHLAAARRLPALREAASAAIVTVGERLRTGQEARVFDRTGIPLVSVGIGKPGAVTLAPETAGLLAAIGYAESRDPGLPARLELSLDYEMQRAAVAALGGQQGGLVAIDVASGALLAAASSPAAGSPLMALEGLVAPGSIIKMITLAAGLRSGVNLAALFPFDCRGTVTLDHLPFRDWAAHGSVESIDEAVAVSCNLAFARLAAAVGADALNAELRRYGFDPQVNLPGGWPSALPPGLGRLLAPDHSHPEFSLARRAEGLDSITITPLHAAVVAAGLARGGSPVAPWIVTRSTNLLGEPIGDQSGTTGEIRAEPLAGDQAAVITRVMVAAVERPDGTARRAAVDGISAAMKTGTSGVSGRLDAIMIGFAPADRPRIAWGVVAVGAGKAEIEAARITRQFLLRIQDRLR